MRVPPPLSLALSLALETRLGPSVLSDLREALPRESNLKVLERRPVTPEVARGVPLQVAGTKSILTLAFDHRTLRHVRSRQAGANYRANLALAYYMRRHGVYLPDLHTLLLSAALEDDDVAHVVSAFDSSLAEMVTDGFFTV